MSSITLEQRVAALETQNRRLRSFTGVLLLLISVPLFVAATGGQSTDVVRASRFEVVRDGKILVQIDSDADGGQVIVRNAAGLRAGYLQASATGGSLDISDLAGKTVGYFDAVKAGGGELCVNNAENKCVALINANATGGSVQVNDSSGRKAAYLKSTLHGGSLDISKNGEAVGYFDATSFGSSSSGVLLCVGKLADGSCLYRWPTK